MTKVVLSKVVLSSGQYLCLFTGRRSYLGDLEDEIENEKELLHEQRSEVAAFKEQLQQQVGIQVIVSMMCPALV